MKLRTLGRGTLVLTGLLLSTFAQAQAPNDGPPPPMPQQRGPGGPGGNPGGPGGRGGGRGGFAGRFSMGTVSAVDAAAGTMTITPRAGGDPQTVKLGPTATLTTQETVPVSSLRVGENVRVTGVPTGITASQIVAGDLPTGFPGAGRGGAGGAGGGGRRGNAAGAPGAGAGRGGAGLGAGARPGGPASGTTTMTASILGLNPLTLSIGDNVSVALKLAPDAKVTRVSSTTLSNVKVGDQVVATGQTQDDGTFAASTVGVNMDLGSLFGGFGRGGFGGPGGGNFGGNGGPGGFGGGRRRGNGQPGGGNAPQAGPPPPGGDNGPVSDNSNGNVLTNGE